MNIDTINNEKIKICLTDEEINSLFGGYEMIDYEHPRSKMVLNTLLSSALPPEELPLDCKKVLIEVHPTCGGCAIFFTRLYEKGKLHRVSGKKGVVFVPLNSEDLISLIRELKTNYEKEIFDSRLISAGGKFALYVKGGAVLLSALNHLKEYSAVYKETNKFGALILEHGNLICQDAVERIYNAFCAV